MEATRTNRFLGDGWSGAANYGNRAGSCFAKSDGRGGIKIAQIERVEVNEAFAPQYLAVERGLGLDRAKTNVNGGAIALGHPLGASGTRLILTLLLELRRQNLRYGLATACIGGGQGIAMIVEANAVGNPARNKVKHLYREEI